MLTVLDRYELRNLSKELYRNCCRVDLRVTDPSCRKRDYATCELKKAVRETFAEYDDKGKFSEYACGMLQKFENRILDRVPQYVQDRRQKLRYRKLMNAPKEKSRINPIAAGAVAGFAIPAAAGIYFLISRDPNPVDQIYSFLDTIKTAVKEAVSADQWPVLAQTPSFMKKLLHEGMISTGLGTMAGAVWSLKPDLRKIRQYAPLRKELKEMLEF